MYVHVQLILNNLKAQRVSKYHNYICDICEVEGLHVTGSMHDFLLVMIQLPICSVN